MSRREYRRGISVRRQVNGRDLQRCTVNRLTCSCFEYDLGEFSSPKQGTFYHYNDFWYLDPTTREWQRLESKEKGPPARSGHRMTYFKVRLSLFFFFFFFAPVDADFCRTMSFCSEASRIHPSKPNIFRISGYMIVKDIHGSAQVYRKDPRNLTHVHPSHFFHMKQAPFYMGDIPG